MSCCWRVDYVGREIDVEQWSFGSKGARVLVLIAVRGGQVRAIRVQSMVTSRPMPQQTAQMVSPLAGQNRLGLRFSQIGQDTTAPECKAIKQNTLPEGRIKVELRARGETSHWRAFSCCFTSRTTEVLTFLDCATNSSLRFPENGIKKNISIH